MPSNEAAAPSAVSQESGEYAGASSAGTGYAAALNAGFQATARGVQEMHQAIAGNTFGSLLCLPGLSLPTRIAQGVHDAIAQGVYATVRYGGSAASALAGGAERLAFDPGRTPGSKERLVRGALNGMFGDALEAAGSALALQMGLHDLEGPLLPGVERVARLQPRVCVFLHGLACDEHSWRLRSDAWAASPWAESMPAGQAIHYGALLEHEPGISVVWLRYNSGLSIDTNAEQLAKLLDVFAHAAPQVKEWLLIGHSMGGLIARSAQAVAAARELEWARRVPVIVCLGSPHQGAPLEKVGRVATAALALTNVTRPIGRIAAARSRGIKDLRLGLKVPAASTSASASVSVSPAAPALRLVYATLGDEAEGGIGPWVGRLLGDGLVRASSAADDGLQGDVNRVALAGLGHMALLNHPRVYAVIQPWLVLPCVPAG